MRTSFVTDHFEITKIIQECDVCFIGLVEKDNTPYVIPMSFGYDGNTLYLHSGPEGRHIDILKSNNKICVSFCSERKLRFQHPDIACSYSMESKSVVCKGIVSFIEDDDLNAKKEALNIIMQNYTTNTFQYSQAALKNVKIWKIQIEEITAKLFGQNFKNTQ